MAIFGGDKDTSFFKGINRELLWDVISQQCSIYKLELDKTNFNIYGEASGDKFYSDPILINCLIERGDQSYDTEDFGPDLRWNHNFRFLNEDLKEINISAEVGDIIFYEDSFYEVHNVIRNQLFMGKDPKKAATPQPEEYSPENSHGIGLGNFGWNVSTLCYTHYVPRDRVGIVKERIK